ncbi:MAG TPA: DNA internalization-related competence protein ComEC/Rec2 [Candidatus Acidoferrum sp.]|nr:DNA internalization-related competence protein ComEC/Rec2 [Candidatus Acidoferrum sp.]
MRLPAVALAASFACGAVLGQASWLAEFVSSREALAADLSCAIFLISAGIYLVQTERVLPAACTSLFLWILLGVLGAGIANQPRDSNDILSLVEAGRVKLDTPLRWHGRLGDEPTSLPWGYGYEIALTGVEYEGALIRTSGGLRLSFSKDANEPGVPDVHAGEEIAAVTQARLPQVFRDEGAFDRRAYLRQQGIELVGTLRSAQLLQKTGAARVSSSVLLARARRRLREQIDMLFAGRPRAGGVLRAMLLGDRSFVERTESTDFQKTGVFHVLVVAGLHVGAIALLLFWIGRALRLSPAWTALITLSVLLAYVAVVEQRPPVLRASLMTGIVVAGGLFYRRLELLNSAGLAAIILLVAKPHTVSDSSFQLTFLAIGCIAGLAVPWLERNVQPFVNALRGWRDVTRDASHEPRAAQFRIDLRSASAWMRQRMLGRSGAAVETAIAPGIGALLRVLELLIITLVLQIGMLPLMTQDFHRVTLSAPLVNLAAVPLTGIIVPMGFATLGLGLLFPALARLIAVPLGWVTVALIDLVEYFARLPRWSYRIPGPPTWLIFVFLAAGVALAACAREKRNWSTWAARVAAAIVAASALVIMVYPFTPRWAKGKLELTVLDVGQGDSLFVVSPNGKTLLIDGGGAFGGFPGREEHNGIDPGEEAVSPYLWFRGFQKLDVVALTHAHQDHIGGLKAILENFKVRKLWIGREVKSVALADLENLAKSDHISIAHEVRGEPFSWNGFETQVLWPENASTDAGDSPQNNDSLVLRLKIGQIGLMLPGDAEKQAEASMLAENPATALQAAVLKVGHHGSKNSTTPEFLAAVHPQLAIISAGADNPYGHPNEELLDRLQNAGVTVLRTDQDGAVHVLTDGRTLEVRCFVACPKADDVFSPAQANPPR